MSSIKANFEKVVGKIKPLHGINNTPILYNKKLPELQAAGIPYVRLHDTGGAFGGSHLVDVPNVFPDFDADVNDPASYDFDYTDAYFRTLHASGLMPFYRLGVTIENNYQLHPYRVKPPKDFHKWAEICCHIVRHYNEGWANGFHYGIKYWEIWNEPESPAMWQGTDEEFFELYAIAAKELRRQFPHLKIGGYGISGFFVTTRKNQSAIRQHYLEMFNKFMEFKKQQGDELPWDFVTWHLYTKDPHETLAHANYLKQRLHGAGLDNVESILGEWNYIEHETCSRDKDPWDEMRGMPGAAAVAATFALLQKGPVDMALYYDAMPMRRYCGLYYYPEYKVSRTYYSFRAFNELYKLGQSVECSSGEQEDGIYCIAAKDGKGKAALLVVNRQKMKQVVPLEVSGVNGMPEILVLDEDRVLTETNWLLEKSSGNAQKGKAPQGEFAGANLGQEYAEKEQMLLTLPPESVLLLKYC